MTVTKAAAGFLGAFLVLLLAKWAAEGIYHMDSHGEASYVIDTGEEEAAEEVVEISFAERMAQADAGKGERVFRKCQACHKLEEGANATGPYLYNVVGREIAAAEGFGYSAAMAEHGGTWTPEALNEFLHKPSDYMPGTAMGFAGLRDIEDRVNVIAYLNQHGDSPMTFEAPADEASAEQAPAAEGATEEAAATDAAQAEPAAEADAAETQTAAIAGDPEAGARVFRKCQACHKLDGKNGVGPHLDGVVGREIGGVEGFNYSNAMRDHGGEWTPERLAAFLEDPRGYIDGTKMSFAGLRKQKDREDVIAYLATTGN